MQTEYITDPDDYCRRCEGKGRFVDQVDGGRTRSEPCDLCGGSGKRSIAIVHARQEMKHAIFE